VMKRLTGKFGQVNQVCEYLAKVKGNWLAVPTSSGTQYKGPCGRISVLKEKAGLDVLAMYPAKEVHTAASDGWTWEAHYKAAEACAKAGMPFAIGLGQTSDSVDTAGVLFKAFGAELIDKDGNVTVKSDKVRAVLEYGQKLVKVLPDDAVSYDDASNNRPDLRQGRAGLEPAIGLGSRQARCTAGGGGLLVVLGAGGSRGAFPAVSSVFLGRVVVQQEQRRRERFDRIPDAAPAD